uniref:Uncharacterized protein n=1 Tax=Neobodo designis TaxID=312471 RepID=A0A7S1QUN1_NEODS
MRPPYRKHVELAEAVQARRVEPRLPDEASVLHSLSRLASPEAQRIARDNIFCGKRKLSGELEAYIIDRMFPPNTLSIELPELGGLEVTVPTMTLYLHFCRGQPFTPATAESMRWLHHNDGITHFAAPNVGVFPTREAAAATERVVADVDIFASLDLQEYNDPAHFLQLNHMFERFVEERKDEKVAASAPLLLRHLDAVAQQTDVFESPQAPRLFRGRVLFALANATLNLDRLYVDEHGVEHSAGDLQLEGMKHTYGVNTEQLRRPPLPYAAPTRKELVVRLGLLAALVVGVQVVAARLRAHA